MNIVTPQVGIDVSKDFLDISVEGRKAFKVENNATGFDKLRMQIEPCSVVHLEASGGHERLVKRALSKAGIKVKTHDALKAKRLLQATSSRAKTDPIDAKGLALQGSFLPEPIPKSEMRERFCDCSRAIHNLTETASKLKRIANSPGLDEMAREAYLKSADDLKRQADELAKRFEERLLESPLGERYRLIQTVPGVGSKLARVCVCELPENLSDISPAQIASYAGLAPVDNASGLRIGRSRLGRGNSRIKGSLYMPCLSLVKSSPWASSLYKQLRDRGKSHQTAMAALMRRQLIRIAAVMKRGTGWEENPQST